MADPNHSAELQRLREQLAELTRRVYQLEELLTARPPEAADSGSRGRAQARIRQQQRRPLAPVITADLPNVLPPQEKPRPLRHIGAAS